MVVSVLSSLENMRSASAVVTGRVAKICNNAEMLGNKAHLSSAVSADAGHKYCISIIDLMEKKPTTVLRPDQAARMGVV